VLCTFSSQTRGLRERHRDLSAAAEGFESPDLLVHLIRSWSKQVATLPVSLYI
jgi:hypothetical protein